MNLPLVLPNDLVLKVEFAAKTRGMTIDQYVRETLEQAIATDPRNDPLFTDNAVFDGDTPADVAANHDDYLYGDNP